MSPSITSDDLIEIRRIVYSISSTAHTLGYFSDHDHPEAEKENAAAWNDFGRWLQKMEDEINGIGPANNGGPCLVNGLEHAAGCAADSATESPADIVADFGQP